MSLPEETLNIQTPENVAFGYQVAGIGSRFLASLVDTILSGLLQFIAICVVLLVLSATGTDTSSNRFSAWVLALFGVVTFLFYWGYYIFFEMLWNGQSPGKRWVGLRVLRTDGTPITLVESLIRNLVRVIDLMPFAYGIGIISMFIDEKSRRLGDLAAGTLVVQDRAPISIQSIAVQRSISIRPYGFTKVSLDGFPVERLTNNDLSLIEDFLHRRDQLTHREKLANQILATLHTRLGLPAPTMDRTQAEDTLVAIVQAINSRQAE